MEISDHFVTAIVSLPHAGKDGESFVVGICNVYPYSHTWAKTFNSSWLPIKETLPIIWS